MVFSFHGNETSETDLRATEISTNPSSPSTKLCVYFDLCDVIFLIRYFLWLGNHAVNVNSVQDLTTSNNLRISKILFDLLAVWQCYYL